MSQVRHSLDDSAVLVVDDEESALRSLSRVLTDEGVRVYTACSINEALAIVEEHMLDAAVVDYYLAGREGRAILAPLRAAGVCSLMISGLERSSIVQASIASGADDFLLKPFEVHEFLDAVIRVVTKTRRWRSIVDSGPRAAADGRPTLDIEVGRVGFWLQARGDLSDRERDVIVNVFMGRSNEEIAGLLRISVSTVKFHDLRARRKLRVASRRELTRLVFEGVESTGQRTASPEEEGGAGIWSEDDGH